MGVEILDSTGGTLGGPTGHLGPNLRIMRYWLKYEGMSFRTTLPYSFHVNLEPASFGMHVTVGPAEATFPEGLALDWETTFRVAGSTQKPAWCKHHRKPAPSSLQLHRSAGLASWYLHLCHCIARAFGWLTPRRHSNV